MEQVHFGKISAELLNEALTTPAAPSAAQANTPSVEDETYEAHAIGISTPGSPEPLIHVGIDTVALKGQHFDVKVQEGQQVKKGDLLLTFDMDAIKASGYKCTTPLIITNTDDYHAVRPLATGMVKPGNTILEVKG